MNNSTASLLRLGIFTLLLSMVAVPALEAQTKFTDSMEVKLKRYVRVLRGDNGKGCNTNMTTAGTHPDPLGRGRDGDYFYVTYENGVLRDRYASATAPAWTGLTDDSGSVISFTSSFSIRDAPNGDCDYDLIALRGSVPGNRRTVAYYQTFERPVAYFEWTRVTGKKISFDASESYVATELGHKPIVSLLWEFGDGTTSSEMTPVHEYLTPTTYEVRLIVYDTKGNADTSDRTVKVDGLLVVAQAEIIEERSDRGDTITLIGIATNESEQIIPSITAIPVIPLIFEFPDSVLGATLTNPVLTEIGAERIPITVKDLQPGGQVEVLQRFVVTKLATYKTASMSAPSAITIKAQARYSDVIALDIEGQPIAIETPCDEQLKGQVPADCERNYITIGGIESDIVVNSVDDTPDDNKGDGKCQTGRLIEVDGQMVPECTLRAAIEESNHNSTYQRIDFNIPGAGVQTIVPAPGLPVVTDHVVIDGGSQPGYKGLPLIMIDGSAAGVTTPGLVINIEGELETKRTRIYGLAIGNFGAEGMRVEQLYYGNIEDNHIGVDPVGTVKMGNGGGLSIQQGLHLQVRNNVISGNDSFGTCIGKEASTYVGEVFFLGNKIGTNRSGTAAIANNGPGILSLDGAGFYGIGDPFLAERNIISGNNGDGILIKCNEGMSVSTILGNFIGTDITGKKRLPNSGSGIHILTRDLGVSRDKIGNFNAPNLISANLKNGIHLDAPEIELTGVSMYTEVFGNIIGADVTGSKALGNVGSGIFFSNLGSTTIHSNLISGNGDGIVAEGLLAFHDSPPSFAGNMIGTDITATHALGNLGDGIRLDLDHWINFDYEDDAAIIWSNIIGSNGRNGILTSGDAQINVFSNEIGLAIDNNGVVSKLGNGLSGVLLGEGTDWNKIGYGSGLDFSAVQVPNVIAYNKRSGISVTDGESQDLRGNLVFSNGNDERRNIDLGDDGGTANDRIDEDEGPNELTNMPEFMYGFVANGEVFLKGVMAGRPFRRYEIDVFVKGYVTASGAPLPAFLEQVNVRTSLLQTNDDVAGRYVDSFATRMAATSRGLGPSGALDIAQPLDHTWSYNGVASFKSLRVSPVVDASYTTSELTSLVNFRTGPQLTMASEPGEREVELTNYEGFSKGDKVIFAPGASNEETAVIFDFGSLILSEPLKFAHDIGEVVVPYARAFDSVLLGARASHRFSNGTAISMHFKGGTDSATISVERFRRAPKDLGNVSDSAVLPHRWVVTKDGTLGFNDSSEISFRLSGIPNLVLDPNERIPERINIYRRDTPGSGSFEKLDTRYDASLGVVVGSKLNALGEFILVLDRVLGVSTQKPVVRTVMLSPAVPNPFSSSTSFTLTMPATGYVTVAVFNSLGQHVAQLHDGRLSAGTYPMQFNAGELTSGMYFIHASTLQGTQSRQVLFIP